MPGPESSDVIKICESCGEGLTPDERMRFGTQSIAELIESAHIHLLTMRKSLHTTECIIAKLVEIHATEVASE